MLYFAYGSNLNHHQMKNIRCFGSKYLKTFFLKNYKLIFCHPNKSNKFGYGNMMKKKGSKVSGAIWDITKEHEEILDKYEPFEGTLLIAPFTVPFKIKTLLSPCLIFERNF